MNDVEYTQGGYGIKVVPFEEHPFRVYKGDSLIANFKVFTQAQVFIEALIEQEMAIGAWVAISQRDYLDYTLIGEHSSMMEAYQSACQWLDEPEKYTFLPISLLKTIIEESEA